jgi:hypothetical protein
MEGWSRALAGQYTTVTSAKVNAVQISANWEGKSINAGQR